MSMVASILVESIGCHPAEIAKLAAMRNGKTQPYDLLLSSMGQGPGSRYKPVVIFYTILVALDLLIALSVQFTSTILLSDFKTLRVIGLTNKSSLNFGAADSGIFAGLDPSAGTDYWRSALLVYPRFAEYSEPRPATY
ncbi:hypothetical protein H072_9416 [Dactylellina haptotyla CBS 200.50]|uniref:Uncharacterized protein n=1 Tax=Dactylellina haptotyla (strain CBS 200.50) TaxID=1284197 RepID=S8BPA3_DACHA|nr:hypothetical protein H072_9416 [Dactylellina haptotyla CBS 200.50]